MILPRPEDKEINDWALALIQVLQKQLDEYTQKIADLEAVNLPTTFANLPAGVAGKTAYITDSDTTTWGDVIAGGGSDAVLAWFNGTDWTVIGV